MANETEHHLPILSQFLSTFSQEYLSTRCGYLIILFQNIGFNIKQHETNCSGTCSANSTPDL